jgi:hypothetical protein
MFVIVMNKFGKTILSRSYALTHYQVMSVTTIECSMVSAVPVVQCYHCLPVADIRCLSETIAVMLFLIK